MATQSASGDYRVITGNSGRVGSDVGAPVTNDGGTMVKGGGSTAERAASAITKHIDVNDIAGAIDYDPGSQVVPSTKLVAVPTASPLAPVIVLPGTRSVLGLASIS